MRYISITVLCASSFFIPNLTIASDLDDLLQSSQKPVYLNDNKVSGSGFNALSKQIEGAMFLSVGEFHLNKETPKFLQALINTMDKGRYDYFAIETGRYSADFLQAMLSKKNANLTAKQFFRDKPKSIAFFDRLEEFELLKEFKTIGSKPNRIWGLDQEFVFSARFLLHELQQYVSNEKAKKHVQQLIVRAQKGFTRFEKENKYDQLLMSTMSVTDFKTLKQTLGKDYIGTAKVIIDELEASRSIYRAYEEKRYYDNNAGRIKMFKTNFMRNYNLALKKTGKEPQVILKMGLYHSGKGISPVRHFDIGNFLSEFAISRGGQSFHLAIVSPKQKNGDKTKDLNKQFPAMKPFTQSAQKEQITYYDLLQVRKGLKKSVREALSKESMDLIHAYDAILVFPQFNASEEI